MSWKDAEFMRAAYEGKLVNEMWLIRASWSTRCGLRGRAGQQDVAYEGKLVNKMCVMRARWST